MQRSQSMKSMSMNSFLKRNFNDIDKSMNNQLNHRAMTSKTEATADKLVKVFRAPQCRKFFLKCAWHLSEAQIWEIAEMAQTPRIKSPVRYFVRSCSQRLSLLDA